MLDSVSGSIVCKGVMQAAPAVACALRRVLVQQVQAQQCRMLHISRPVMSEQGFLSLSQVKIFTFSSRPAASGAASHHHHNALLQHWRSFSRGRTVDASATSPSLTYYGREWSGGLEKHDDHLFDLTGQKALITGAAGAVGSRAALALARYGADVALADLEPTSKSLAELAAKITGEFGRRAVSVELDVTSADSVSRGVEQAATSLGGLSILVSSHGALGSNLGAEEVSEEEWGRVVAINLDGVFRVCRACHKHLAQQHRGGKVVIMGSIAGSFGYAHQVPYCAAKAGLVSMSKAMAQSWAKDNIQVNVVQPGALNTMFTSEVLQDEERLQYIVERIPAGRLGIADDVVGPILFLASRASDYVTGTTLTVDGGGTSRAMAKM